eukprot:674921-Rhodomonas_salina.1
MSERGVQFTPKVTSFSFVSQQKRVTRIPGVNTGYPGTRVPRLKLQTDLGLEEGARDVTQT